MDKLRHIATLIVAVGGVTGAPLALPAPYGAILAAIIAAAAVFAKSPLEAKPGA